MAKLDLIIRNALIIDGSGSAGWIGDVGVKGDRIDCVDSTLAQSAYSEMDARGHALTPGFIDAHTHDDKAVIDEPNHFCKLSQGVTTVVVGNCGISFAQMTNENPAPAPLSLVTHGAQTFYPTFDAYFAALAKTPPSVNVVAQTGHSVLRFRTMDSLNREATRGETAAMQQLFIEAMEQGAAGLSTGLEYPTAIHSTAEEIAALTDILHEFGGFYSTHMRDEGENVLQSLDESIHIGKWSRVPVIISHHKLAGVAQHGRSVETLDQIDKARRAQIINFDAYPYVASSTMLDEKRVKRASRTMVAMSQPFPDCAGRDFSELQAEWCLTVEECVAKLSPALAVYFNMAEEDVQRILSHPAGMIGSDGIPDKNMPHPRLWGTFPKVLGHYVRDVKLFTLEQAVHKMTGLPAQVFGIKNRGIIAEGAFADLVLFNQAKIKDEATFEKPMQPATGIDAIFVNGKMSYARGKHTGFNAGRGLKRNDLKRLLWS